MLFPCATLAKGKGSKRDEFDLFHLSAFGWVNLHKHGNISLW